MLAKFYKKPFFGQSPKVKSRTVTVALYVLAKLSSVVYCSANFFVLLAVGQKFRQTLLRILG